MSTASTYVPISATGPDPEPEQPEVKPYKFLRSTTLKLRPTTQQRRKLDLTASKIHERAQHWSELLLTLKESADPTARDLYWAILACATPRGFLYFLRDHPGQRTSYAQKGEGFDLARQLYLTGGLPLQVRGTCPPVLDHSAFDMAVSGLKSYEACDARTRKHYAELQAKLAECKLTEADIVQLDTLEQNLGFPVSPKMARDFGKWGFTAFRWAEQLAAAGCIVAGGDEAHWNKLFKYSLIRSRIRRSKATAQLTLPDPATMMRPSRLGSNFLRFKLHQVGTRLRLEVHLYDPLLPFDKCVKPETIDIIPTRYWQNLQVTPSGTDSYELQYRRGNASPLNEDVVAILKELALERRHGQHYVRFGLNCEAIQDPAAVADFEQYKHLQPVSPAGPVLVADLGTSRFWNWSIFKPPHYDGQRMQGTIGDPQYNYLQTAFAKLRKQLRGIRHLVAYLKLLEANKGPHKNFLSLLQDSAKLQYPTGEYDAKNHEILRNYQPPCPNWIINRNTQPALHACAMQDLRLFIKHTLYQLGQKVRPYRRFDLHRERQTHLCHEQLDYIWLVKDYIQTLKGWRFFGHAPTPFGQERPGFERWQRYITNLRTDLIKKSAQELVFQARRHECMTIVIEDLEFERRADLDRKFNDLVQLWSPRSILGWVRHFAQQYGIIVILADPSHTSQIDPQYGTWASRDKYDKTKLYVRRDGQVLTIHADLDAACGNLFRRYVDRVGAVYRIGALQFTDHFQAQPGGKIQEAFLLRTYGTKTPCFGLDGKLLPTKVTRKGKPKTKPEVNGKAGNGKLAHGLLPETGKDVVLYRHGDTWITREARLELQDALRTEATGK